MTKATYVRLSSDLTLEDLKRLEAEGSTTERPKALPLKDIHVAPLVFQWRPADEELAAEEQLMNDLVRFIEGDEPPRALDPVVVAPIGKQFFVIDGHHRLDAYHTAQWKELVPIKCFEGTLKEAEAAALRYNFKNKLPMTQNAKSEAAWRMTLAGAKDATWARTRKEIMRASGVSRSTVKRMALALRRLGDAAFNMTWADVRKEQFAEEQDDADKNNWREEKARKLADYLVKGPNLTKDPQITARALEMVSGHLPPGSLLASGPRRLERASWWRFAKCAQIRPKQLRKPSKLWATPRRISPSKGHLGVQHL